MGALFIFISLIYFCGVSFSQECRQGLLKNTDFPGNDISVLRSPDAEHCQLLCTQHASCLFFAFVQPDSKLDQRHFYCFLKSTDSKQPTVQIAKQGTTSGFSLKPCNPEPRPCLPRVYDNVDFPFSDYQTLFTADYQECQRVCTHDPGCQFFAFTKSIYKCWLKFSWTVPTIPYIKEARGVISGFSLNILTILHAPLHFKEECQGKFFPKTDFPGDDILVLPAASPGHCLELCTSHPLCTYFSYIRHSFRCYLKRNTAVMAHRHNGGITSGLPARFCQLDNSWTKKIHAGVDFPGSDLRYIWVNDVLACQKACTADHNCQFFSYIANSYPETYMRSRCYLKRTITIPAPPQINKSGNTVSGFSLRNCPKKA